MDTPGQLGDQIAAVQMQQQAMSGSGQGRPEPGSPAPVEAPTAPVSDRVPRPGAHKIAVGAVGGALTVCIVWVLNAKLGAGIPMEVAGALQLVVTSLISIAVPNDMEAP